MDEGGGLNTRDQMIQYRNKVIKEIEQTERSYVEQLETITKDYLVPLRNEDILTNEEITKIFSVLELIRDVNKTLLQDIQKRVENWSDTQCIGDVFLTLGHFLKMYSQYCANFTLATDELISIREKSRSFRLFEEEHPLPLNSVESYLILPVQRIPRYFLLLEDFLANTWKEHQDYSNIVKAVRMIKGIADYVNNRMKTLEHINRVYEIDIALGGECKDLVVPHRRWIAQGELSRIRSALISYTVPVRIYLFNDLLVVAEKTVTSYRYNFKANLMETFVVPEDDDKFKNLFRVVSLNISVVFTCKTEEEKEYWLSTINTAINDLLNTKNEHSKAEYKDARASLADSLRIDFSESGDYKLVKPASSGNDFERGLSESELSALKQRKIRRLADSPQNLDEKRPGVGFIPNASVKEENPLSQFRRTSPAPQNSFEGKNESDEEVQPEKIVELESKEKPKSDLFQKSKSPEPAQYTKPHPPPARDPSVTIRGSTNPTIPVVVTPKKTVKSPMQVPRDESSPSPVRPKETTTPSHSPAKEHSTPSTQSKPVVNEIPRPSQYNMDPYVKSPIPYSATSSTKETSTLLNKSKPQPNTRTEDNCSCIML